MKDLLEIAKGLLKYSQDNPEELETLNKQEPAKKVANTPAVEVEEPKALSKTEYIKKQVIDTEYAPVFQKSLEKDVIDFKSGKTLDRNAVRRRVKIQGAGSAGDAGIGSEQARKIQQGDRAAATRQRKKQAMGKEEMSKMGFANPKMGAATSKPPTQKPKQSLPSIPPPKAPKGGAGGAPAAPMMKDSDHVVEEKKKWKKDSYNSQKRSLPKRDRRKEDHKAKYSKEELDMAKKDCMSEYKPKFQKGCDIPAGKVIKPKG